MGDFDLSRREFMQVGSTSLLALSSGQITLNGTPQNEYEFQGVADLMGPETAKPEPGSDFFDNKQYYWYRYQTFSGNTYFISQDDSEWTNITVIPTSQLNEVETQQASSFFNHTFARPEAPDDKNWVYTDADVTKVDSEVELASSTELVSTQRGNYPPGNEATPGCAWRVTGTPTAGEARAGYYDSNNGAGVGEDATDSFVFLRKGGTEAKVYRSNWNGHVPETRVWDDNRPIITRFPHLFYGGGDFKVMALLHGDDHSELRELHRFTPESINDTFPEGPPFDQPNLPIRFESSSLTGGSLRANAAHYQFSLAESENRVNGEHYGPTSVGTTGWTELITWRKRSGWEMVNVRPLKIAVTAATNPVRVELQLNPTTSSTTTTLPTHTSSDETSVEIVDGTINSDGERRWVGYAPAGQGNSTDSISANQLTFNLPVNQPVSPQAQAVGGSADVAGSIAWEEYF